MDAVTEHVLVKIQDHETLSDSNMSHPRRPAVICKVIELNACWRDSEAFVTGTTPSRPLSRGSRSSQVQVYKMQLFSFSRLDKQKKKRYLDYAFASVRLLNRIPSRTPGKGRVLGKAKHQLLLLPAAAKSKRKDVECRRKHFFLVNRNYVSHNTTQPKSGLPRKRIINGVKLFCATE